MSHADWVDYPTGKIGKGEWCECCGRFNNRVVACMAIGVKKQKIVLVKRAHEPERGSWAIPGGYLNWDETLKEAAMREFYEETGLKLSNTQFLGYYDDPQRDKDGRQNIAFCYVGEVVGEEFKADIEVEAVGSFSPQKLPEPMAFDHAAIIEDYLQSIKENL